MTTALQQLVTLYEGKTVFSGQRAVIELLDDNRFVMFKVDPETGLRTDTVLDVPVSDLAVKGAGQQLVFTANGLTKRVDFAPSRNFAAAFGGLAGLAIASAVSGPTGIKAWRQELKERGVQVKGANTVLYIVLAVVVFVIAFAAASGAFGS